MRSEVTSLRTVNAVCLAPLRDSTLADQVRAPHSKTTCVATHADRPRDFTKLPARRLVSARGALQKYAIFLELQQGIVPGEATVALSQPPEGACSVPDSRRMPFAGRGAQPPLRRDRV